MNCSQYTDTFDSSASVNKRKCIDDISNKINPPPTPLSCMKTSKSYDSHLAKEAESLSDIPFKYFIEDSDSEDDDSDESTLDFESSQCESSSRVNSTGRPRIDDSNLKYLARLVESLNQLFSHATTSTTASSTRKCLSYDTESVKPLHEINYKLCKKYLSKTVMLCKHLIMLKPDHWSLMSDITLRNKIREIYTSIRQNLKDLKQLISDFQGVILTKNSF